MVAFGIFLTAIGGYGAYFFGQKAQRDRELEIEQKEKEDAAKRAYSGVLEVNNETLLDADKKIYPQLELGDSGSILKFTEEQGTPLFKIAEDNDIIIETEGENTKVSCKIRDREGRIVAEIIKNEWKVNPEKSWDRNYSNNALELKDPSGDIILQIKLVEDRIQFQAKLYDASGRRIGFGKSQSPEGGGVLEFTGQKHPELELKIQPIFKYPSELHLGEFAD
jgi:hypothetical protein